ncbi:porin family protein [Allorhizobium sp. BGMRC 0089]|uniref:outer membrane protein n=1 Tax=Allorhizobium sonneratiae TaxID=2934936 RepID=UPI002033CAA4|nr:outer membrane protein [Allorhizobium sonneratiae]MCM2290934.1 porin family protein [Allorhizobium sonneratiae]
MKISVLAVMMAGMIAAPALGADLVQPDPAPPAYAPEIRVSDNPSGWYLRGDVGYSFNHLRGAHYYQGSNASLVDFTKADVKNSYMAGVGVGYQVNSRLRTDLTFDYTGKSDFNGSTQGSCGVASACTSRDISSWQAYTLMANAYIDLGTYNHITPYVGAGIGGSYVKWDALHNTSCDDSNSSNCDATEIHDGRGKWRFAYQVMAGASIDLTCNWKADIGYRFRQILGGDMFGYRDNGGPGSDKGFTTQTVQIGARYQFGGCPQPVAYEAPPQVPLVYK